MRVPEGQPINITLSADDLLQKLVEHVQTTKQAPKITLVTTFDRKTYTADDYAKTFRQLSTQKLTHPCVCCLLIVSCINPRPAAVRRVCLQVQLNEKLKKNE